MRIKLKYLERKEVIKSKILDKERYFKIIKSVHRENDNTALPKEHLDKEQNLLNQIKSVEREVKSTVQENISERVFPERNRIKEDYNYASDVLKIDKYQRSIEVFKAYLKGDPHNEHYRDLLNKANNSIKKIKEKLEKQSRFICLTCKEIFRSQKRLNNHIYFKHKVRPLNCPYCNATFPSESDLRAHQTAHELDLHGLFLNDAKEEVIANLTKCEEKGMEGLILIHGYHHGQVLKNHFRSENFIREMKAVGFNIYLIDTSKPGSTGFLIKNKKG
ncbi:MAG: Smr/MutS family protein [Promethearchaeota archaeon]